MSIKLLTTYSLIAVLAAGCILTKKQTKHVADNPQTAACDTTKGVYLRDFRMQKKQDSVKHSVVLNKGTIYKFAVSEYYCPSANIYSQLTNPYTNSYYLKLYNSEKTNADAFIASTLSTVKNSNCFFLYCNRSGAYSLILYKNKKNPPERNMCALGILEYVGKMK